MNKVEKVPDTKTANAAREEGVEKTIVGNLRDPNSLRFAAEGADGIFHLGPAFAPDEAEVGIAMVEATKAAGVKKFVFSSVIHLSILKMENHAAKQPVEAALYESGLDFTVLQPVVFMQTLDDSWAGIV